MAKPSRAELLEHGGVYPVVVPLGWKLIGSAGEDVPIPPVPGAPFHRILAQGALLATEEARTEQAEMMMVRHFPLPAPITNMLDRYADAVMGTLAKQGLNPRLDEKRIGTCTLSDEPCAKVVVSRLAPRDGRLEIHFLVRDKKDVTWELTYLLRQAEIDRWRPLLAEVEGPLLG